MVSPEVLPRSPFLSRPGRERGVERIAQRDIARVAGQSRAHAAGHISIADAGGGIGEAERAAGAGEPNDAALPKRHSAVDFMNPSEN